MEPLRIDVSNAAIRRWLGRIPWVLAVVGLAIPMFGSGFVVGQPRLRGWESSASSGGPAHLEAHEYVTHYNAHRPHRALGPAGSGDGPHPAPSRTGVAR